jgi:hypothetical protein
MVDRISGTPLARSLGALGEGHHELGVLAFCGGELQRAAVALDDDVVADGEAADPRGVLADVGDELVDGGGARGVEALAMGGDLRLEVRVVLREGRDPRTSRT